MITEKKKNLKIISQTTPPKKARPLEKERRGLMRKAKLHALQRTSWPGNSFSVRIHCIGWMGGERVQCRDQTRFRINRIRAFAKLDWSLCITLLHRVGLPSAGLAPFFLSQRNKLPLGAYLNPLFVQATDWWGKKNRWVINRQQESKNQRLSNVLKRIYISCALVPPRKFWKPGENSSMSLEKSNFKATLGNAHTNEGSWLAGRDTPVAKCHVLLLWVPSRDAI